MKWEVFELDGDFVQISINYGDFDAHLYLGEKTLVEMLNAISKLRRDKEAKDELESD